MIHFSKLVDVSRDTYKKRDTKKKKNKPISDTIYSFDIEVCSLFKYKNGLNVFDYSISQKEYKDIDKFALPYIWQFGVNDVVYYGREFMDFYKVLDKISDSNITKVIWVHNLAYEFQFLLNIFDKYNLTIENMVARDIRKPISFHVKELNITFRCSYMLTNMSLATASAEYTNINKLDSLDYDDHIRTPLTKLTDDELKYCEYDILCLYEVVRYFKDLYKHIALIPLTSTGRIREEIRKVVDFYYIRKMQDLVPPPKIFLKLWSCFAGGYTHANIINAKRVIYNAKGKDIASSYPYLLTQKLPSKPFLRCPEEEFNSDKKYGYIALVHFKNVKSKYFTHYMQISKCIDSKNLVNDNGRVVSCDECFYWLTDVDFRIIEKNYKMEYEVIECYKSYLDYLDVRIIKLILSLYNNKTRFKGVEDKKALYKVSKEFINSIYGMAVTNPLKQSTNFVDFEWNRKTLNADFITEKVKDMERSYSTLMFYGAGVYLTALARERLMKILLSSHEFDMHVIYCDTDSIKYFEDYDGQFDHLFFNDDREIEKSYKKVCQKYPEIKINDFKPKDKNGVSHDLGKFEDDGKYSEFLTLGAKKYCYREDGKLKMTLAGVSKKAVSVLNDDINNFKNGLVFGYKDARKMTHLYNDNQEEFVIDGYKCNLKYSIVLYPTTYTLGTTDIYDMLWDAFELMKAERRINNV